MRQSSLYQEIVALGVEFALLSWFWILPLVARIAKTEPWSYKDVGASVYFSAILVFLGNLLGRFKWAGYLVVTVFLFIGSAVALGSALSVGGHVKGSAVTAILDTNFAELSEFLQQRFSASDYFWLTLLLAPIGAILFFRRKLSRGPAKRILIAPLLALAVAPILAKAWKPADLCDPSRGQNLLRFSYPFHRYPPLQVFLALDEAIGEAARIAVIPMQSGSVPAVKRHHDSVRARTHVVIIGESLSRHHMGLYGYYRETTPRLSGRADELFVFRDVISPQVHTVPSLSATFFLRHRNGGVIATAFDLINAAGYRTYWISNQPRYGVWESMVSKIVRAANVQTWINPNSGGMQTDIFASFDERLLPELEKALRDSHPEKFIFLHLMGNHADYSMRYPKSFEVFPPATPIAGRASAQARVINQYDNAVVYNDHVIDAIIRTVGSLTEESLVLYLSDHGEEVFDHRSFFGHSELSITPFMTDVPFVLWLSTVYRVRHPEIVEEIKRSPGKPYMFSEIIHTVSDLAGFDFEGKQPAKSIVTASFDGSAPRYIGSKNYDVIREKFASAGASTLSYAALGGCDRD
jgi:heptose-I-phosphate ethanolaminephosphotransferase